MALIFMKMELIALGFSLGMVMTSAAGETRFESGATRTSLLELYTSEGCSSCPPAEARLSRLKEDAGLWKKVVPIAYHVDYWDRLGWPDRYASKEWTERQGRYAALWQSESVYTPAFVLDGRELRGGLGNFGAPNEKGPGVLNATSKDGKTWAIEFRPTEAAQADWEAHVALLGAGISAKIGAGENGGRNLHHDFVVLRQQSVALIAAGDRATASLTISSASEGAPQKAVAVWVTRRGQLPPVQATGGWLAAR